MFGKLLRSASLWALFVGLAVAGVASLTPSVARAQGLLVDIRVDRDFRLPRPHPPIWPHPIPRPSPDPPQTYKIKELAMQAKLQDQVAKVQVSQSFVNTGSRPMEVSFLFPLPYDGAVDQLTFMVDGKEFEAKLLSASEARRIYEEYVRRNQDPALLEWMGTGMFKTSIFPVPAGAERTVTMRYSQVCRKAAGLTELLFPLSTAKYTSHPVEKVSLRVTVDSQSPIKNVYSPTHSVEIKRPGNQQAIVSLDTTNEVPQSDFRLFYDVGENAVGTSVLSYRPNTGDEGFFLLLASPEIGRGMSTIPKTAVFVVDRSGSMSGKKIEQAKGALKFVLNNLREGDLFNVIAYDTKVESFRPELQRYTDETRQQALGFVEGIYAGGSTNIDGALNAALSQLQDKTRPSYVVFLTDGLPTTGETRESQIVDNAKSRNQVRARVFNLGVGFDVNSRLLDKLGRECFGQSEYVRPNEDIESHVSRLYNRIGAPALTDLAVTFDLDGLRPEQGAATNRVYPRQAYDLFAGDQLVLVGRYKKSGMAKITIGGKVDGAARTFDFPAQLVEKSADDSYAFVEKLWAVRRVGEIIDEIDLRGKNQELIDELTALSTKHGILTPYTSFLADENAKFREVAANARRAGMALDALAKAEGREAFAQRVAKGNFQRAAQAPAAGAAVLRDEAEDRSVSVQTIKNVANKTFFQRGAQWVDSTMSDTQEKNVRRVQRYSPEYFDLVSKYGRQVAPYLAMEGEVFVVLDGQAYAF